MVVLGLASTFAQADPPSVELRQLDAEILQRLKDHRAEDRSRAFERLPEFDADGSLDRLVDLGGIPAAISPEVKAKLGV